MMIKKSPKILLLSDVLLNFKEEKEQYFFA
jgi:hypothetical protein